MEAHLGDVEKVEEAGLDAASEESKAGFADFRRVFSYNDGLGWLFNCIALFAAVASGALLPLMDLVFGKTVTTFTQFGTGQISPDEFRSQSTTWTLWFIYLFIAKFCLSYVWTVLINITAIQTTNRLRAHYLRQVLRQDISFFDQASNAAVAVQISTNGNLVNVGIAEKLGLAVQGIATFVAAFAVAFAVQWKLTLITLSIVPTIVIVVGVCVGIEIKNETKILDIYARAGSLAEDVFSNMRNVHAFWAHPRLAVKYDELLLQAKREGRKKRITYGILFSTEFFCVNAGYGLAFWQGIRMYVSGEISSAGQVVTVIFAVIVAATALTQVAPQFEAIAKAASAAHALFELIDRKIDIDPMSTAGSSPTQCAGEIEIQGVKFHYPSRPDAPILQGVNLTLPAGKTTALVGASGSGKSTVIGMIERWYRPTAGKILLDGVAIEDVNISWLRTHIRLVQQEPVLFNGTVFDNVAYGLIGTAHADASREDQMELVRKACKAAFAHDFICELPDGYDAQIGERAAKLSGGQKQRIAIARSIVSDPTVLLLDEATSALDPQAEKIVQAALENVSTSRTTLVIAHKLSTVRKADNIAVMSEGAIVEQGTHDELLALGGQYARLVAKQDLRQNIEGEPVEDNRDLKPAKEANTLMKPLTRGSSRLIRRITGRSTQHDGDQTDTEAGEQDSLFGRQSFNFTLPTCLLYLAKQQPQLWPWFGFIALLSTLGGGVYPALAVLFARAVTTFQLTGDEALSQGSFWALMFFIVAIAVALIFFALGWTTALVSQETTYFYRLQYFNDVMNQDIEFFDMEQNTTGSLVASLSSQPTDLQELIGFNVALILIILVNIVASSALAIAVGWKLGLTIALTALPVMVVFGYLRIRLQSQLEEQVSDRFSSSAAIAGEAVAAIRTVASLALEKNVLHRYEAHLNDIRKHSIASFFRTMILFSISQSINFLAMALGFWYGSRLLSTGEYDQTQFFTVFVCVIFAGEAAAQFFGYSTSFTKAQRAANHLLWLHSVKPRVCGQEADRGDSEPDLTEKIDEIGAEVDCSDLTFSYPLRPDQAVLRGVSVAASRGQSIGLVGASGCGKTTIVALLERFFDPTSGQITYNDQDITQISPRRYRSHIALVQQEPTLYQGTVRENIALGKENDEPATDAEIIEACKKANIHDFITSLADGFNTYVGSRGAQLSGGQRQRIAIARALIRRPKLLLLDEATSALDTESERLVQDALREGSEGCTTIAVAHRLSTVRDCDCIFVLMKGKVVEQGRHDELVKAKGIYYEMCLGQSLDDDAKGP